MTGLPAARAKLCHRPRRKRQRKVLAQILQLVQAAQHGSYVGLRSGRAIWIGLIDPLHSNP